MQCPRCGIHFHENWSQNQFRRGSVVLRWQYRNAVCPSCKAITIEIKEEDHLPWRMVEPISATRGPVPPEVPDALAADYAEACNVYAISPKASAALSRRCLQNILNMQGYKGCDLAKQIDSALGEADPNKALGSSLSDTIDVVRNFGNFSAHPIDDKTTLQIIEVEPHEAEWCLQIVEEMFDHFYVRPAKVQARKSDLNEKLKAAGKPAAK